MYFATMYIIPTLNSVFKKDPFLGLGLQGGGGHTLGFSSTHTLVIGIGLGALGGHGEIGWNV